MPASRRQQGSFCSAERLGEMAVPAKNEQMIVGRHDRSAGDAGGDYQAQWARVRGRLREEFGDAAFRSLLSKMTLFECGGNRARIGLPTRFLREWVAGHYADRIRALWNAENPAITVVDL